MSIACQNGGMCVVGGAGPVCVCAMGYSGEMCEINVNDCEPNPCQNGGMCTDGVNDYTCACAPGFSGEDCEINDDDCSPNPCLNGGMCNDGVDAYTCTCLMGYTGQNCETAAAPEVLVINEVDYDQPGGDTGEFVEIYNPGPSPATLSRWTFEHVNGANGQVSRTIALSGAGTTLQPGAYLVIGVTAVVNNVPQGTPTISAPTDFLQNGSPDGARLKLDGVVVEGVSWEGAMTGTGEGASAPIDDGVVASLSRCPNGADTNDNGQDFVLTPDITAGSANICPAPPAVTTFSDVHPIYAAKCMPCHTGSGFGQSTFGDPNIDTAYLASQQLSVSGSGTVGAATLIRIQDGSMPQGGGCTGDPVLDANKPQCLTQAEQDLIQAWLDDGQLPPAMP